MQTDEIKVSNDIPAPMISLKVLSHSQIQRIDDMLSEMGPFGELRLIKKKGSLRFIERVESFDFSEKA
jgi:hypothetical protein